MEETYFSHVRRDIEVLLPRSAQRILDIGAGTGATSAWLKSLYPSAYTIALEGNALIRDRLAGNVDEALIVDLNQQIPDVGSPDLILCLDVLEHLIQPMEVLRRVADTMSEDGTVIVSLPNVAHASVAVPLLVKGRFEYQDAGILDRTHLHFFDRVSAVELLNHAGLVVRSGLRSGLSGPRTRLINIATGGLLRDCLTKQYIMAATRANGSRQGPIAWSGV